MIKLLVSIQLKKKTQNNNKFSILLLVAMIVKIIYSLALECLFILYYASFGLGQT